MKRSQKSSVVLSLVVMLWAGMIAMQKYDTTVYAVRWRGISAMVTDVD